VFEGVGVFWAWVRTGRIEMIDKSPLVETIIEDKYYYDTFAACDYLW
jgi:hypothetical protein